MKGDFHEHQDKNLIIDDSITKTENNDLKKQLTTDEQLDILADIIVNYLISEKSQQ